MQKLLTVIIGVLCLALLSGCAVEPTSSTSSSEMTSTIETNLETELRPSFMVYNQPDVIWSIQKKLNSLGYNAGSPDGVVGAKTATALIRYQRAQGIAITGQINEATLRTLDYLPVTNTTEVFAE